MGWRESKDRETGEIQRRRRIYPDRRGRGITMPIAKLPQLHYEPQLKGRKG
jgi:hypothetical protein